MRSTKKSTKPNTFPKLQIAANGNIFIMQNPICGVQVFSACGCSEDVGNYYKNLTTSKLSDYTGSITLEN